MIELYTRYTLTLPAGSISDTGIRLINDFIQFQSLKGDDWKALNPDCPHNRLPALPDTWEWTWVVQRGEYAGTFPKRVANFYFKTYKIRVTQDFLQQLGNIARAHSAENVTYTFEFVDSFDWNAGDFGDHGSCYWGGNSGAREMLKANSALAIRFYNADDKGIARAWLFEAEDNLYIVWNGYGFPGYATLKIARIVATFLNLSYKKISLSNHTRTGGTLYINSGIGYAVGTSEAIDSLDSYDFEWADINEYECYNCGDGLTEDETYTGADGETYCLDCFYNRFDTCYECGETHWHEDLIYIGDYDYCEECAERLFICCDNCGEYVLPEQITNTPEGDLCENCAPESDESEE